MYTSEFNWVDEKSGVSSNRLTPQERWGLSATSYQMDSSTLVRRSLKSNGLLSAENMRRLWSLSHQFVDRLAVSIRGMLYLNTNELSFYIVARAFKHSRERWWPTTVLHWCVDYLPKECLPNSDSPIWVQLSILKGTVNGIERQINGRISSMWNAL